MAAKVQRVVGIVLCKTKDVVCHLTNDGFGHVVHCAVRTNCMRWDRTGESLAILRRRGLVCVLVFGVALKAVAQSAISKNVWVCSRMHEWIGQPCKRKYARTTPVRLMTIV
eukprot:351058-Chlamydomonas_euryale.AAC.9